MTTHHAVSRDSKNKGTLDGPQKKAADPSKSKRSSLALQLKGMSYVQGASALSPDKEKNIGQTAQSGFQGGGSALPYLDLIQNSFGAHDVRGTKATVGGAAKDACDSLDAKAYASGNQVAFKESPSLHTAAHEAAHVVQQKAGVSLKGNVGQAGDKYEQHADAVADAVVQGKSAEGLLDQFATRSSLHVGSVSNSKQASNTPVQKKEGGDAQVGERARAALNCAQHFLYGRQSDVVIPVSEHTFQLEKLYTAIFQTQDKEALLEVAQYLEGLAEYTGDAWFDKWIRQKVSKMAVELDQDASLDRGMDQVEQEVELKHLDESVSLAEASLSHLLTASNAMLSRKLGQFIAGRLGSYKVPNPETGQMETITLNGTWETIADGLARIKHVGRAYQGMSALAKSGDPQSLADVPAFLKNALNAMSGIGGILCEGGALAFRHGASNSAAADELLKASRALAGARTLGGALNVLSLASNLIILFDSESTSDEQFDAAVGATTAGLNLVAAYGPASAAAWAGPAAIAVPITYIAFKETMHALHNTKMVIGFAGMRPDFDHLIRKGNGVMQGWEKALMAEKMLADALCTVQPPGSTQVADLQSALSLYTKDTVRLVNALGMGINSDVINRRIWELLADEPALTSVNPSFEEVQALVFKVTTWVTWMLNHAEDIVAEEIGYDSYEDRQDSSQVRESNPGHSALVNAMSWGSVEVNPQTNKTQSVPGHWAN